MMTRRNQSYGSDSEWVKLRLSKAQAEKLKRIAKRIAPTGTSPTLPMALRHLIEEAEV